MSDYIFYYPVDMSLCIITDTPAGHKSRPGYKGSLAYDIASIGGKRIPVYASINGEVISAGWSNTGYGNEVIIANKTQKVQYAHLDGFSVKHGDLVVSQQMIGTMGSTGNSTGIHLHWATWVFESGKWVQYDPIENGNMAAVAPSITPPQENPDKIFKPGDEVVLMNGYDYVNLRSGAGIQYADIGDLTSGVKLRVIEQKGEWVGVLVWVHSKYVTKI